MEVGDCLLISVPKDLSVHNHLVVRPFFSFSFSGSMVGVNWNCVAIWIYTVMNMRGSPHNILINLFAEQSWRSVFRGGGIDPTPEKYGKKKTLNSVRKHCPFCELAEAGSTWEKTLQSR